MKIQESSIEKIRKKTGILFNIISTLTIQLYKQNSVAIPLVSINQEEEESQSQRDKCTSIFTETLFTIAKACKRPKCLLTDEGIKKMWYMPMIKYDSA